MVANYKRSVFIFRRDLRLKDNTGLIQALRSSHQVIPCFIFDPEQIHTHRYQSKPALQFMLESLQDLERQLSKYEARLSVFYGKPADVLNKLIRQHEIDAVYVNKDYTPFSIRRDKLLEQSARSCGAEFYSCNDLLLIEPEYAKKVDGTPYTVFTPFYRNASKFTVDQVQTIRSPVFSRKKVGESLHSVLRDKFGENWATYSSRGGRKNAIALLGALENFTDYEQRRNFPSQQGTTRLSAHNKFGTCSVREIFYAIKRTLGADHALLRELYWRDFFTHIGFHFPHVFGHSFRRQYDKLNWNNNKKWFNCWCKGETGFPIVDAGMRELNETGYMHNRVRMITASFLTKDLQVDWRWGERFFARNLVDYDPCVNNGNWQWAASTGCDAQPYFRIFNPWLQQKKFDKDCQYIKRWIPALRDVSPADIHRWEKRQQAVSYPSPVVDHSVQSAKTKAMFKGLISGT